MVEIRQIIVGPGKGETQVLIKRLHRAKSRAGTNALISTVRILGIWTSCVHPNEWQFLRVPLIGRWLNASPIWQFLRPDPN